MEHRNVARSVAPKRRKHTLTEYEHQGGNINVQVRGAVCASRRIAGWKGERMTPDELATLKEALDELAFSVQMWTTRKRQLYEKAIRILEEHGG